MEVGGAVVQWVVFEDCLFENVSGPTLIVSALFRQTTLVGRFGRIMFRDVAVPEADRPIFRNMRRAFYESPLWALDISRAEFLEFDCRNIPGDRIRRAEADHGLMTRSDAESALAARSLRSNAWRAFLEHQLQSDLSSWVLVPPRGPNGTALRGALAELRAEGYSR